MQLEAYLQNANYFSLGHLPTESLHPLTLSLSDEVETDLKKAISTVQKIDLHAMEVVKLQLPLLQELAHAIDETLHSGSRVFLSGCGATGRLALTLEALFRSVHRGTVLEHKVQALMAGGDFALVKSVENFEDFSQYGQRHLLDLGFKEGDLLIAITEGGETPYVIGTVQGAIAHSRKSPWFVYCNPTALLIQTVERSRETIENPRVKSLCLPVGPMALSGSTRLQAATAQMLAVGVALFQNFELIDFVISEYAKLDLADFLAPIIEWETKAYQRGARVLYQTSSYPIAVLTDTTERSPTFSLAPFEKSTDSAEPFSLCYLSIPAALDPLEAWHLILGRAPIGLEWEEFQDRLGIESILEFDFSRHALASREARIQPKEQAVLQVESSADKRRLEFKAEGLSSRLETPLLQKPLAEQILIKLILNTHSLMVMGKLKRYEGNVMTWVRASNGKLIDRTVRYLEFLIQKRKLKPVPREKLIELIFEARENVKADEAVILKILEEMEALQ